MQAAEILHKYLSNVMHKTRLITLSLLVGSLFHAKFFSLTGIGRALKTVAQERSAIRRVDRFLSNKRIEKDRLSIYRTICRLIVGGALRPLIIVDWSPIPNKTDNILRAALVTTGRALTLYEEVHPQKKYANPKLHLRFLKKLKMMLDPDVKPIIISDAGFHNSWFDAVQGLGWDYVGRIRGNKLYRFLTDTKWSAHPGSGLAFCLFAHASTSALPLNGHVDHDRLMVVTLRYGSDIISQPNISALESNIRQMGRERAIVLAKALKVHPAILLFPDCDIKNVA